METAITILSVTVAISLVCLLALAILGYLQKRKEQKYLEKFNEESIQSFMDGQETRRERRKKERDALDKLK